jgi:hypothetical protein
MVDAKHVQITLILTSKESHASLILARIKQNFYSLQANVMLVLLTPIQTLSMVKVAFPMTVTIQLRFWVPAENARLVPFTLIQSLKQLNYPRVRNVLLTHAPLTSPKSF